MASTEIRPLVFVSTPYAGRGDSAEARVFERERNIEFAAAICRDIALHTDAMPMAPHLLFPQFLDDHDEFERGLGLTYCNTLLSMARYAVFVVPAWRQELSYGMRLEYNTARDLGVIHRVAVGDEARKDLLEKLALVFPKRSR